MRRVPARYVVAVIALAWALASLGEHGRTTGAFFSSPPAPVIKPALYLPTVNREYPAAHRLHLPVVLRK